MNVEETTLQIDKNDKFALITLPFPQIDGGITELSLGSDIWLTKHAPLNLTANWREWIGTIRNEQFQKANGFLIIKCPASQPSILDGENQTLMQQICYVLDGLLIVTTPYCQSPPFLITGANVDGTVSVRGIQELTQPVCKAFNQSSIMGKLNVCDFQQAKKLGDALESVNANPAHSRIKRALSAFFAGIRDTRSEERLHQFCRSIDGIIFSRKGQGKRDFRERACDFIDTKPDDIMDEIYEMRSAVEHLRPAESEVQNTDLRRRRLRVLERSVQSEAIARFALQRVLLNNNLLRQFEDDQAIERFWTNPENTRRNEWGTPLNFNNELQSLLDQQFVDDADLGIS